MGNTSVEGFPLVGRKPEGKCDKNKGENRTKVGSWFGENRGGKFGEKSG